MGQEFQTFLTSKDVTHQISIPHTSQQNGCAKRFNQTILENAEAMCQYAYLPKVFWQDACYDFLFT